MAEEITQLQSTKRSLTLKYVSEMSTDSGNHKLTSLRRHITRMTSALFAIQNVGRDR